MGDRRYYQRPRTPPSLHGPRNSLPSVNYGTYSELHAVPLRREVFATPRNSNDRVNAPVVTTTYKIKPDVARGLSVREGSRSRRSTLDSSSRPIIVTPAGPKHPPTKVSNGRPASPFSNAVRSTDDAESYYSIPATSGRNRTRRSYHATMDNADMNRQSREGSSDKLLLAGRGRESAMYPRSRPVYSGSLVRHPDTVADDYGDDGYGYTNPRDLVQYDLNRTARNPSQRRDSYEGSRSGRPSSISGFGDVLPRSFDARERGPPPTTRGLDKMPGRAPIYDAPSMRAPSIDLTPRPSRADALYPEPVRRSSSRRPVSVYQEPDRRSRDEQYDIRDEDLRDRRKEPRRAERYEESIDRGIGARSDRNDKNEYDRKSDYDKRGEYDRKDDYNDRSEHRKSRDVLTTGLGIAGAALGLGAVSKARDDDRDDRDERDDRRKRDADEEYRRRRMDTRESVDLSGRDPKERQIPRDDRSSDDNVRETKDKGIPRDEPLDLTGRNPQEKPVLRDEREARVQVPEMREHRRSRSDHLNNGTPPSSRDESPASDEVGVRHSKRDRSTREGMAAPFNPKDTTDLRALKEALNKQDAPVPTPILAKEPLREQVRESGFDPRDPRDLNNIHAELARSEERGRQNRESSGSDHSEERRAPLRVVSPPREEVKVVDEKPVKGILRQPREKFPEDPAPIREGVAPLKDAKKDGVPPDARWTKISRKLVNPDALEIGKERYEARDDFVIVLRVLSKEEVQAYATATQQIRAAREEEELRDEREAHRRRRRERHERHRTERHRREDDQDHEHDHQHRRQRKERDSHSESDSTPDDEPPAAPKAIADAPKSRRITFDDATSSSLAALKLNAETGTGIREDPDNPGTYLGYTRTPPRRERREVDG